MQAEVLDRIHSRQWKPGDLIPNEADLAEEFGCARTTVNRALRSIAEGGLLERRRKAGTRIAMRPVRKATLNIPIIRQEIEERDQSYDYHLVDSELAKPPTGMRARMKLPATSTQLHLRAVHLADGQPYVYEDRWLNPNVVPEVLKIQFETVSANEWLVMNAPFTKGNISFSATQATSEIAEFLGASKGDALFTIERTTWDGDAAITSVRMIFAPGYIMRTTI